MTQEQNNSDQLKEPDYHPNEYVFEDFRIAALTNAFILQHSSEHIAHDIRVVYDIHPQEIGLNYASFTHPSNVLGFHPVSVRKEENALILSCACRTPKKRLCEHQTQVLFTIMNRAEIRVFFDATLRHEKMKQVAKEYGLEKETNLDEFFQLEYANKSLSIKPKRKELFPINPETTSYFETHLLPKEKRQLPGNGAQKETQLILVFRKHKYYDHLLVELYEAQASQEGKIKKVLNAVPPLDRIWKIENTEELKFYTAISKFQHTFSETKSSSEIAGLQALVKNPLNLDVFYHNPKVSDQITAASIVPVKLTTLQIDVSLSVNLKGDFYEVSGQLLINEQAYELRQLNVKYTYFILVNGGLHLIDNADFLRIIDFFKQHNSIILIHQSQFASFQQTILAKLENKVRISYSYVKPATKQQLAQYGFDRAVEQILYLSDSESYVLLTPVMKYGNVEVPVFSKKQVYATDANGNVFAVERDEEREVQFTATLLKQHPDFYDQLNQDYLYLHKDRFLDEGWFLDAFEEWKNQRIMVLGFNELRGNKLNPNKAKVSVHVSSGLDWFDTTIEIQFGKQKVSLKHLHKSLRNKSKFVQLDDGTLGVLPAEWIEKFAKYFYSGDIVEEKIRTPRVNFSAISELYAQEVLSEEVKNQLALYKSKIANFEAIQHVEVPTELNATLRDYQKQGLNWLNFLDEFGFGGCLADDMGLGKTIQIIAFILSQRAKATANTNLIVVPTSLIFNWQTEVAKFAPSIKIHTIYGTGRAKNSQEFDQYEIILTSYGTLLSDIRFLKEYRFNYIFLDESQNIKNPESLRYKAVRLLQSRNKIVLTGTPIENNTFDIYGQLSFACPGLLGSKQHFKDHYSMPIDKFKDIKRGVELQKKINPFMLRRTKRQVATELPDKTEMVIYCEMGTQQRKVYDAYRKEFRDFLLSKEESDIPQESMHVLQGLTKLRQICNSAALLNDEAFYGDSSSKIEVLLEEIENKSPEHKILVFSQFVGMLELIRKQLEAKGITFEYLTGQTKNRAANVNAFQNNPAIRVFLISLKAGGVGLNLTEADYVYLVDPWWNPAVENQAIDRSYRIGQKNHVVAVRLICPDTIEEKILRLQESKKELVNDLVKTDASILKSLSKKELIGLFS